MKSKRPIRGLFLFASVLILSCSGGGGGGGDGGAANSGASTNPGVTPSPKRVFVTSTTHNGNFSGTAAVDTYCNTAAANAGLSGTWVAWISDSTADATSRLSDVSPWYLVDGTTLVFPTMASITTTGPAVAISMTETGGTANNNVWTATAADGTRLTNTCLNWANAGGGKNGTYGSSGQTGTQWTNITTLSCNNLASVYCFEQ